MQEQHNLGQRPYSQSTSHTSAGTTDLPPFTPHSFPSASSANLGTIPTAPPWMTTANTMQPPTLPTVDTRPPYGNAAPLPLKKNRAIIISMSLAFLVIIGIAVGIVRLLSKATTDVTLYQAGMQNVTQYVGGGGVVYPRQQLVVYYPTAEQAVKVLVKPGDTVSVNQPLIQLDPTQINIQIKQASDDLAAAQAYLNSVSVSGPSVAIAQAQQQYDIAQSRYNALVSQYSSLTVHGGNLVATMAGVVTEVDVNSGEVFHADVPLLTIMDESTMIVHVKIPLSNLEQVHLGQTASVTPSALPNVSLKGEVSSIIPQADPQTDTFEVWVNVSDPGKNLLPGMNAFVQIQNSGSALAVPRLAVVNPDRDSAVFLFQNDHVILRRVSVMGYGVGVVYIDKGLSTLDKIVLVGIYDLHDGQKVRVVSIEQAGK